MMKMIKSKNGKIGIGILVLLLVIYFVYMDEVNAKFGKMMGDVKGDPEEGSLDKKKILSKGSKGLEVKALQMRIKEDGGNVGDLDGIFGEITEKALVKVATVKKTSIEGYDTLTESLSAVKAEKDVLSTAERSYN